MASTTSTTFQLSQLDYDGIKSSLITFLQSQTEFSDYDFTGSALQVIINLLAYNTHYLGYYLNMISKEMFIDSAQLRQSVVSLAKQLSYTPRSRTASSALINLVVTATGSPAANITLEKNTPFSTQIDGVNYNFLTTQVYTSIRNADQLTYNFNNVLVREGVPFNFQYTVNLNDSTQRFIIPSPNTDTTTLTVKVQNSSNDTTAAVYTLADTVSTLNATSLVYFLQEVENSQYQVYFGNGVLGKTLNTGNIVILSYLTCNADIPNKAKTFSATQPIGGYSSIIVNTVLPAYGGGERETIDSIRSTAPIAYQAQNRAVTANDFKTIITKNYPNIDAISVWGGQDSSPPQYGKVFISIKPVTGYTLSSGDKTQILKTILAARKVMTIVPELVDPDITYLNVNTVVTFDPKLTTLTAGQIVPLVAGTINTTNLNGFDAVFRYSTLVAAIDYTDNSIVSNLTSINLQKIITPYLNTIGSYISVVNSNNPIEPGTLTSTQFICTNDPSFTYIIGDIYQFDDDGLGHIRIFKIVGGNKIIVKSNSGTIDYIKGIITISNFIPSSIINGYSYVRLSMAPIFNDVINGQNNIIQIDPSQTVITVQSVYSAYFTEFPEYLPKVHRVAQAYSGLLTQANSVNIIDNNILIPLSSSDTFVSAGVGVLVNNEVPLGTINGTNNIFNLVGIPNPGGSLLLTVNGQIMYQGVAYTLTGNIVSFNAGYIPQVGDLLRAWYQS